MRIAIIGAGISGATAKFIIEKYNKDIIIDVFEKRDLVGGNCQDRFINGNYIQYFGPHIFHTNKKYIWNYLNIFSDFIFYQHKVLSYVNGEFINFPIIKKYIDTYNNKILKNINKNINAKNAEDYLNKKIGIELTNLFFKNYSEKQWGIELKYLPIDIVKRIPIRNNNDIRYFSDKYQGIPRFGFSETIIKILNNANVFKNINITYDFFIDKKYDFIINTGSVDEFFNYDFGELEYRKILFKFTNDNNQPCAVINYPNDYDFTRITQFNYFSKSNISCIEYPTNIKEKNNINCYPIFWSKNNKEKLKKYIDLSNKMKIINIGRMGLYQYLNIDTAIDLTFENLKMFNSEKLKESLENDFIF